MTTNHSIQHNCTMNYIYRQKYVTSKKKDALIKQTWYNNIKSMIRAGQSESQIQFSSVRH